MLLNNAAETGKTQVICAKKGGTRINNLMFTGDCILSSRSNQEECQSTLSISDL